MRIYVLFIFIILISFSGCGAINYHLKTVDETVQYIKETREQYEKEYLGKAQETIFNDLGEPYFIRSKVFLRGQAYDEERSYRIYRGRGIMRVAHTVRFYIKDGKIAAIDVW